MELISILAYLQKIATYCSSPKRKEWFLHMTHDCITLGTDFFFFFFEIALFSILFLQDLYPIIPIFYDALRLSHTYA